MSGITAFYQKRFGSSQAIEQAAFAELQQTAREVGIDYQASYRPGKNYGRGVKNLSKSLNGKTVVFKSEKRALNNVAYPVITFHNQKEGRTATFNGYQYLKSEYEFVGSGRAIPHRPIVIKGPVNDAGGEVAQKEALVRAEQVKSGLALFDALPKASADFPYLARKGLSQVVGDIDIRQGSDGMGHFIAFRLTDVNGSPKGLQKIYADGRKRYTQGMEKSGSFVVLGVSIRPGKKVVVSTGFSTSCSVYLALKRKVPVVVALDDANLLVVTGILRQCYQGLKITYACDNDTQKLDSGNSGMRTALRACFDYGGRYVTPSFKNPCRGSDFNDVHIQQGLSAVAGALKKTRGLGPDKSKALTLGLLRFGGLRHLTSNLKTCITKLLLDCPKKLTPNELIQSINQNLPPGLSGEALVEAEQEVSEQVQAQYLKKQSAALRFSEATRYHQTDKRLSYLEVDSLDDELLTHVQESAKGVFIIQGPTGCGKTKFMSGLIGKDERAGRLPLYVTGRELLTAQAASRMQIPNYQTVSNFSNLPSLALCWNSLINPKYAGVVDNTQSLYIDEPTMTLRHGLCGTVDKPAEVLDKFKQLLAQAGKMVLCDADMNNQFIDFLCEHIDGSLPVVLIRVKQTPRNKTIRFTQEQSVVLDELLRVAKRGDKFMLMADSRERLDEVNAILQAQIKDISLLQVDSQNKNLQTKRFIENPDQEIEQYQGVLCSPAISCGVSIEKQYFEHHFALFGGCSIIPQDALQMLARDRTLSNVLVSLNPKSRFELEDEHLYYHERKAVFQKSAALLGISTTITESEECFCRLHSQVKTLENSLRNDFANNFLLQAAHDGYDLKRVETPQNKALTKALKNARKTKAKQRAVAIFEEPLPNDIQAHSLEGMGFRTQNQSNQLQKYILTKSLGVETLTLSDIEYGLNGGSKYVSNFVNLLSPDCVLADKDKAQRESGTPLVQLKNYLTKKHVLEKVFEGLNINLNNGQGVYSEQEAQAVVDKLLEEDLIDSFNGCHFGVRLKAELAYPVRFVNDLLKSVFGLSIDTKQVQKNKIKIRQYQIEKTSFEQLAHYGRLKLKAINQKVNTSDLVVLKNNPCVHRFESNTPTLEEIIPDGEQQVPFEPDLDECVLEDWIDIEY